MGEVKKLLPEGRLTEADLQRDYAKMTTNEVVNKILEIKTANQWMEEAALKPAPLKLVDCLLYQGELVILFADTNLGKSILAVQIADALTYGNSIYPFQPCKKTLKVLYCDFEMSDKQFENRYSNNYQQHYQFHLNFIRAELNLNEFLLHPDKPIEEHIGNEIMEYIRKFDVDVVIVDNLTYIFREIEKSKNIQPLMQKLKWINKENGTSILVLAHTPKRDMTRPLTNADIAGSKFLSNFADSIIAIGKSAQDESLRYIKQVKSRNSAFLYGADNVVVFIIEKDHNFLCFKFQKFDDELNHLRTRTIEELKDLDIFILEEHDANPDWSFQKIAIKLGTNKMRVKRVIDRNTNS